MSKNWLRLLIITAAVIVIAALAYAVYLMIMSDSRVKRNKRDSTGASTSSAIIDLSVNRNLSPQWQSFCKAWQGADGV